MEAQTFSPFPFLPSELTYGPQSNIHDGELIGLHGLFEGTIEASRTSEVIRSAAGLMETGKGLLDARSALALARLPDAGAKTMNRLDSIAKRQSKSARLILGNNAFSVFPHGDGDAERVSLWKAFDSDAAGLSFRAFHPDTAEVVASYAGDDPMHCEAQRMSEAYDKPLKLFRDIVGNPHVHRLYRGDLEALLKACIYVYARPDANVVVTVGLGGSPDLPTVRTLSYPVATLEIMEAFHRAFTAAEGPSVAMPKMRILHGRSIARKVNNGFDPAEIDRQGDVRMELLTAFVNEFAPHLARYCTVEHDDQIAVPSQAEALRMYETIEWSADFRDVFHHQVERVLAWGRMTEEKNETGKTNGAHNRAAEYLMSHAALFLDVLEKPNGLFGVPDSVISVGGPGELFFNTGRGKMRPLLRSEQPDAHFPESARLITGPYLGRHPPYYSTPGDTPLREFDGVVLGPRQRDLYPDVAKSVQADNEALLLYVGRRRLPGCDDKPKLRVTALAALHEFIVRHLALQK